MCVISLQKLCMCCLYKQYEDKLEESRRWCSTPPEPPEGFEQDLYGLHAQVCEAVVSPLGLLTPSSILVGLLCCTSWNVSVGCHYCHYMPRGTALGHRGSLFCGPWIFPLPCLCQNWCLIIMQYDMLLVGSCVSSCFHAIFNEFSGLNCAVSGPELPWLRKDDLCNVFAFFCF